MPDSLIDLADLQVGAEDFLVAVLETTAQPIWVVDPDGVIRFANPAGRLPPAVEATAYFVVSEALTNVAKHSRAERAEVTACVEDSELRVQVRDDGVGGAQPDGSGLLGLGDRVAALDGRFRVETPAGGGTLVTAHIPLRE